MKTQSELDESRINLELSGVYQTTQIFTILKEEDLATYLRKAVDI